MNFEVEVPDLGLDAGDHATVVEWNFDEGEYVEEGDVLLEIATEAGTVEIVSPKSGTLLECVVEEDEIVRTGEPVAIIEIEDDEEFEDEDEDEEEEEDEDYEDDDEDEDDEE